MYRSITMPEFYQASKQQKFHLIDVREVDEFISGHVPNAQNNPLSHFTTANLEKDLDYLLRDLSLRCSVRASLSLYGPARVQGDQCIRRHFCLAR